MSIESIGNFPNLILPAKLGDLGKIIFLKRKELTYKQSFFIIVLIRVFDLLAVSSLLIGSLLFLSNVTFKEFKSYIIAVIITFIILVFFTYLLLKYLKFFSRLLIGPTKKLLPLLKETRQVFFTHQKQFLYIFLISILVWIFDISTLYTFLIIYKVNLHIAETTFVLTMSNLVKILPLTPNGIGLYEGTMAYILKSFGISESLGFTISLLDHTFMNIYTIFLAIFGFFALNVKFKTILKKIEKDKNNIKTPEKQK